MASVPSDLAQAAEQSFFAKRLQWVAWRALAGAYVSAVQETDTQAPEVSYYVDVFVPAFRAKLHEELRGLPELLRRAFVQVDGAAFFAAARDGALGTAPDTSNVVAARGKQWLDGFENFGGAVQTIGMGSSKLELGIAIAAGLAIAAKHTSSVTRLKHLSAAARRSLQVALGVGLRDTWAQVCGCLAPHGLLFPDADAMVWRAEEWAHIASHLVTTLKTRLNADHTINAAIEWVAQVGPYSLAVVALPRLLLSYTPSHAHVALQISEQAVELYPTIADAWENLACSLIAVGRGADAREIAIRARVQFPGHTGLALTELEAVAMLGNVHEVLAHEDHLRRQLGRAATLSAARGAIRAGGYDWAARFIQSWVSAPDGGPQVLMALEEHPAFFPLFERGQLNRLSPLDCLRVIVAAHLKPDGHRKVLGPPSPAILTHVQRMFLQLHHSESILYFTDWSLLGDGSSGLVLTDMGVQWRSVVTGGIARIGHRDVSPDAVTTRAGSLCIGVNKILFPSLDPEPFAQALRLVIARVQKGAPVAQVPFTCVRCGTPTAELHVTSLGCVCQRCGSWE